MPEVKQPDEGAQFHNAENAAIYAELLTETQTKAAELGKPDGPKKNPMARFNLDLDGQNPDWQPTAESGIPLAEELVVSPELRAELDTPRQIADPESGQSFSALFVNWPKDGESSQPFDQDAATKIKPGQKVLVALPQYNITTEHEPLNYLIERMALETGEPMVVINNPSTAESSDLTEEQTKALKDAGDFGALSRPMLRTLKEQGITTIDLFGYSMGARVAASLAAEAAGLGIAVENLVLLEAPGTYDVGVAELADNFIRKEGKNLGLYQKHPNDARQIEAAGLNKPVRKQLWNMARGFIKAASRRGMYTGYPQAMTKPTLPLDALQAMTEQPDLKLTLINAGASTISPSAANEAVGKFLVQKGVDGNRIRRALFSGEAHSIGEGAKRIGHLVKTILQPQADSVNN